MHAQSNIANSNPSTTLKAIDQLSLPLPLYLLLATVILGQVLYISGFDIRFDVKPTIKSILYLWLLYQTGYIVLLNNHIRLLKTKILRLNTSSKMSSYQFQRHVSVTTDQEVAKLVDSAAYKQYLTKRKSILADSKSKKKAPQGDENSGSSSSSDSEEEEVLTSHQLATKKKLF